MVCWPFNSLKWLNKDNQTFKQHAQVSNEPSRITIVHVPPWQQVQHVLLSSRRKEQYIRLNVQSTSVTLLWRDQTPEKTSLCCTQSRSFLPYLPSLSLRRRDWPLNLQQMKFTLLMPPNKYTSFKYHAVMVKMFVILPSTKTNGCFCRWTGQAFLITIVHNSSLVVWY